MTEYAADRINGLLEKIGGAGQAGFTRKDAKDHLKLKSDRGVEPYLKWLLDNNHIVAVKSWDRRNGRVKWFYYLPKFAPSVQSQGM